MFKFPIIGLIVAAVWGCYPSDVEAKVRADINLSPSTVLVGGCFDILHYGHVRFLEEAKNTGGAESRLVVALESDARIFRVKKRPPCQSQKERAFVLRALRCVDEVIMLGNMQSDQDYDDLVNTVKPQVIAVTADDPWMHHKERQASHVGARVVVVTPRLARFSSSFWKKHVPCSYEGTVETGTGVARTLGYPTANMTIDPPYPLPGVYSGMVEFQKKTYGAMCYYDEQRPSILEVHIFGDTPRSFVGETLVVTLKDFVRAPERFLTQDALKKAIAHDANVCQKNTDQYLQILTKPSG